MNRNEPVFEEALELPELPGSMPRWQRDPLWRRGVQNVLQEVFADFASFTLLLDGNLQAVLSAFSEVLP
ncbi:MAG: hypothetical protein ACE5O2_10460 [Armatimonadota bacterium]